MKVEEGRWYPFSEEAEMLQPTPRDRWDGMARGLLVRLALEARTRHVRTGERIER